MRIRKIKIVKPEDGGFSMLVHWHNGTEEDSATLLWIGFGPFTRSELLHQGRAALALIKGTERKDVNAASSYTPIDVMDPIDQAAAVAELESRVHALESVVHELVRRSYRRDGEFLTAAEGEFLDWMDGR